MIGDLLKSIVTLSLAPSAPRVVPGDAVCIDPDFIVKGDIPLRSRTIGQALEHEAFTGHADNEVTGWIREGQIALVVGVFEDEAYLWAKQGRGWIGVDALMNIHSLQDSGN